MQGFNCVATVRDLVAAAAADAAAAVANHSPKVEIAPTTQRSFAAWPCLGRPIRFDIKSSYACMSISNACIAITSNFSDLSKSSNCLQIRPRLIPSRPLLLPIEQLLIRTKQHQILLRIMRIPTKGTFTKATVGITKPSFCSLHTHNCS